MVADLEGSPTPAGGQHATDEDLADVNDALEAVVPDAVDEAPSPATVATVAAALDVDEDAIEKFISASREKRGDVHQAQTKADLIIRQAEEKAADVLRKAEASLQERARTLLSTMLTDPYAAAAEFKVSADDVIRSTAEASDPNAKLYREMRGELTKRDREIAELRTIAQKLVAEKETETREKQRENWNRAQEKFLADADPAAFPALNHFWGKKRFLGEALEESQAIHEAASVLGGRPEFTDKQIIVRLEKRAREELKAKAKELMALVQSLETPKAEEKGKAEEKPKAKTIARP
jgi:vacuolar-type H+-ATPase subunit H